MKFQAGKYVDESERVLKAIRKAGIFALRRLGFLIRQKAKESLEKTAGASPPSSPPHTHRGILPKAILYGIERHPDRVLVGPSVNVAGTVGAAFEHDTPVTFRGRDYPPRPFMGPALQEEIGELPGLLADQLSKVG